MNESVPLLPETQPSMEQLLAANAGLLGKLKEANTRIAAELRSLRQQLANVTAERDHYRRQTDPFIEWAQDADRFDSGTWAGFSVFRMVMAEFDKQRERLAAAEKRLATATDEAVRAVEELARAVLDMDTWGIAGSNFDPALRLTDIETLNRLRHLASKVIPAAQATTTGGASDE